MNLFEVLYCVLIITVVSVLVMKWRPFKLEGVKRSWVLAAFYLKVIAGLGLTYIYTSYYPDRTKADIFKYFDDSEIMYQPVKTAPLDYVKMVAGIQNDNDHFDSLYYKKMNNWYRKYETVTYNDSHTIIRINALIRLISFGYFQVHNLIFIILSFLGLVALYKTFCKYFNGKSKWLYGAIFLIPSIVFWSSGAMKESVLFFAIGIFIYAFQQLIFISFNVQRVLMAVIGVFLLFFTKMYVLAVLIPVMFGNLWIILTNNRHAFAKQAISMLFFINLGILIGVLFPAYNMFELFVGKLHDFIGLARFENAGSLIEPIPVEPHFVSFLQYTPQAIMNTLLRPFPNEMSTILMIPAIFENILLIILIFLAIFFHEEKIKHIRIVYYCLFFSLVLSVIIGITTPVFGALVRYRIPAVLFLYIALFLIIDFNRIAVLLRLKQATSNE